MALGSLCLSEPPFHPGCEHLETAEDVHRKGRDASQVEASGSSSIQQPILKPPPGSLSYLKGSWKRLIFTTNGTDATHREGCSTAGKGTQPWGDVSVLPQNASPVPPSILSTATTLVQATITFAFFVGSLQPHGNQQGILKICQILSHSPSQNLSRATHHTWNKIQAPRLVCRP